MALASPAKDCHWDSWDWTLCVTRQRPSPIQKNHGLIGIRSLSAKLAQRLVPILFQAVGKTFFNSYNLPIFM